MPRTLFEARKVAGSSTYKEKSMKPCCHLKSVCLHKLFSDDNLFIHFVWA